MLQNHMVVKPACNQRQNETQDDPIDLFLELTREGRMKGRAVDFHNPNDGNGQGKSQQEPVNVAHSETSRQFLIPHCHYVIFRIY